VVTELLDFSGADGDADRSAARCPTLNTIYRRDALASALQSDQGPVNLAFLFSTNLKSSPQAQCKQEMQRHLFGAPPRATPAARSASSCCTARPGRSRGRAEPGFVPVTPARVSKYPPPSRRTVVASTFYKAVIFYISCVNGVDATNNGPVLGFDRRSVPQQPGRHSVRNQTQILCVQVVTLRQRGVADGNKQEGARGLPRHSGAAHCCTPTRARRKSGPRGRRHHCGRKHPQPIYWNA
jgi:hypothetical protein